MKKSISYFGRILCAFMLCTGLVLTSCEGEEPIGSENTEQNGNENEDAENDGDQEDPKEPIGGENTEQNGNENEGGENGGDQEDPKDPATLNLDKVTATTATFTGHLNVAASDLSFSQVTVYYSDAETFNMNAANSVSATSFDNQQNFTIALTNLKYGTKYSYCMVAEIKSEKTYGDVLDFTTDNVTLSDLSVSPSSFETKVSGSVTGLSDEDKEYVKVGVLYSSEQGNVESGNGKKIEASEILPDGTFSIIMSDLTIETKYYYSVYVRQGDSYTYETPAEFTTLKHPYELPYDLDVASATDLSAQASANCYIVSESGLYKFKAVKGNSTSSVASVSSAAILWESFGTDTVPNATEIVAGVCYKDGYIAFQTADTFKEGNAVVAAKDASDNILWSWHIWLTDQPEGQEYYNNAGTMMDRNLGATSATPGDVCTRGLIYQWGRKDPFLGAAPVYDAKSTITWPSSVSSDSSTGTIVYAIANPTTFITSNDNNYDWYYTGDSSTDKTRWTTSETSKSIYDPCPAGWRVPDGERNGVWSKALNSSSSYTGTHDNANKGINFSGKFGDAAFIWYPASGVRSGNFGNMNNMGNYGYYWSASYSMSHYSIYASLLFISSDGHVDPCNISNRANGLSVRCLRE